MSLFEIDWEQLSIVLVRVALAFVLALPIGWERGRGRASVGFRTLPIVALAACGFALIAEGTPGADAATKARVLQGIITGIGFVGGGAIIKHGGDIKGLVTAASIWNAGAIGVSLGYGRLEIALVLAIINFLVLLLLTPMVEESDRAP